MAHRYISDLTRADVTPKEMWRTRRQIMAGAGAAALGLAAGPALAKLGAVKTGYGQDLEPNSWADITSYNNFYEFGTGKEDPARNSADMVTDFWTVKVDGLVDAPGDYTLAQLLDGMTIEERIYRFRCVEAWSMVVPWAGFELADLLNKVGVKPEAKYVSFETAVIPGVMEGVSYPVLDWPYREGLRLDEAMHPLTIMATGLYDEPLPNQNGAPLRLVVPWKYGFKSIKSIVRISLVEEMPETSWNLSNAREYGFFSNVNPLVDHPRWSQATERRIGGGLFARRQETLMFNGYEAEVASLYDGMDLAENY
ncbi:protein-methionine-sulfoxide reductase catalytic subunit MsrP [Silicimonas algicola]|uniref:Protein-methionine-sulfoxide reductase catalytic subunit MsrP n=1 Tax=Silicimonas algicola TaxID=1826607 RepID=A0A316GBR2_9RHOB|nr:protein-methionine-sulfoxide reductase catalytic subunit MsrP [Silicimonas algicola]AZQ66051.1 protein-methionine-sulfoxide reductase catalytic subunit MsrP [Silicimonas algicola]PWK58348.1 sulfoxide reductase catalytic subunit YedY [Silicimonas algicola]